MTPGSVQRWSTHCRRSCCWFYAPSSSKDFVEITHWGAAHMDFLRRFLPYKDGIPSHDALNDLINALNPKLFLRMLHRPGQRSA